MEEYVPDLMKIGSDVMQELWKDQIPGYEYFDTFFPNANPETYIKNQHEKK